MIYLLPVNKPNNLFIGILIGAFIGVAIAFVLFQNKFHKAQSQYQRQNIIRQAELIDSMRRSDLGSLMSNVLEQIDDELKQNQKGILSDATIDRIVTACYAFNPYVYAKGDTVATKKLSPERGRLLLMLSN